MRLLQKLIVGMGIALAAGTASAGASQQQADQLGKSLTMWGADPAGNADKTIPAYTGGLPDTTAPPGWVKGSGRYDVGPYDGEKPLFSITASDYEKYADRLSAGTIAMLKKYPEFRVDVYPTHRSVTHSSNWLSHCKTNAAQAKISSNGNGFSDAYSCVPFPIPTTGAEVIWNMATTDLWGVHTNIRESTWYIDADGHLTDVGQLDGDFAQLYQDPKRDALDGGAIEFRIGTWMGPPSQVGSKILQRLPVNYDKTDALTWVYFPGQRRTRVAPDYAYDTPIAADGGAINYDELFGFTGSLDRYDFKIVGKKELYVMYNSSRMLFAPVDKMLVKSVVNPDVSRWELHRVWVVEATLKAGKRHVQPRRTLYIDEDTWACVASDAYDQAGALFKAGFYPVLPLWDKEAFAQGIVFYDLSKRSTYIEAQSRPNDFIKASEHIDDISKFTPSAMTASGLR
ncbi:DUF1329 domain-containing protein [Paraburkholderia elongata]|uniref:DUF1329 domain-containing protein n=1 Tax=Paraburkholderia elongata TaxID=2675747 RepID=A0A972NP74_9BURK|nr:DUF1329 domain-containing protein [Paraburkholderia elongata]NPT57138.1 DUF1329 domain-containing protein [Paraburkholderia elongata]